MKLQFGHNSNLHYSFDNYYYLSYYIKGDNTNNDKVLLAAEKEGPEHVILAK